MFINKEVMKHFIKRDERTHGRTDARTLAIYNLPSQAYLPAGDKNAEFMSGVNPNDGYKYRRYFVFY